MARLVTKFKYLKPNRKQKAGGYAKYIATREGAEKIDESFRYSFVSGKQCKLIEKLLKDFPDTKEMHEYKDYLTNPNAGNASDFISRAIEDNAHIAMGRKTYADYIATRPRAERFGSHGLFTDDGVEVKLDEVSEELNRHNGNVWTVILSLRREDAERLGFGEGKRWRDMLRSETQELSENFKISLENLKWYAAFHNESHHPHVHMIIYSKLENEGYLTERGVQNLRSTFARDIFAQDLVSVYEEQTLRRDELKTYSKEYLHGIVQDIGKDGCSSELQEKLLRLAERLAKTKGKKVYGYLKADVKALVRCVVDELEKDERIAELYALWYEQREQVIRTYTETLPERIPLSENNDFKYVRNAVIQAAMQIVNGPKDETELPRQRVNPSDEEVEKKYRHRMRTTWELYFWAKRLLNREGEEYNPHRAAELLKICAERGNTVAMYRLGKMYLTGEEVEKDVPAALKFLEEAAKDKNEFAEYLLGKTYFEGEEVKRDVVLAERYLKRAVNRGNKYAALTLGTALLEGDVLEKSVPQALELLTASAQDGFVPAHYLLGKLYYKGEEVEQDLKKALEYLEKIAREDPNAAYLAGKICMTEAERNTDKAIHYFGMAAENGNDFAEYRLGKIYLFGTGVKRDKKLALCYLRSSAEKGNVYAAKLIEYADGKEAEKRTYSAIGALWLLHDIARMMVQRIDPGGRLCFAADKKLRKKIEEKKQAQGLKQD